MNGQIINLVRLSILEDYQFGKVIHWGRLSICMLEAKSLSKFIPQQVCFESVFFKVITEMLS